MDSKKIELFISIANFALKESMGRGLKDLEKKILEGTLEGLKYEEIAKNNAYTFSYIEKDVGPKLWKFLSQALGESVSKTNFQNALESYHKAYPEMFTSAEVRISPINNTWSLPESGSAFYGRVEEIATLKQWIITENSRLVAISGMGGMGKSTIAIQVVHQLIGDFDYIIWRSLHDAPSLAEILTDLVSTLSNHIEAKLPDVSEQQVAKLLEYVHQSRCLLILDNFESVFQSGSRASQYRVGYEAYGHLLSSFSKANHHSCLLLTSREIPKELIGVDENLRVRSLFLGGLSQGEGLPILTNSNCFSSSDEEWQTIFRYCNGSPLALKILAAETQDLFAGNISSLLAIVPKSELRIEGIQDLLDKQFSRLSIAERCVMYWLAIEREPITIIELEANIISNFIKKQLLTAVQSLKRRFLIEGNGELLSLQPVVIEFVTDKFVQKITAELINLQPDFLEYYAILKAQSKDYIRQAQIRSILEAITDRSLLELGNKSAIEQRIQKLLIKQRQSASKQRGYLAGNLINLLSHLKLNLHGYDFSALYIRQAYLQTTNLQNTNFTFAIFDEVTFNQAFNSAISVSYHPDGFIVATGNTNGEIYLWQINDGQQISKLCGHTNWVHGLVFSPDGSLLASSSYDRTVRIWDWRKNTCSYVLDDDLLFMSFSPNGQLLATTSKNEIQIRNLDNGSQVYTLKGHDEWVTGIRFHPHKQILISGSGDCTIRLWDLERRECLRILRKHKNWVITTTFSPDGKLFLSSSTDHTIGLWSSEDGEYLGILTGHRGWVWMAFFSPDGKWIASCSDDGTIKIWDYVHKKCIRTIQSHDQRIWSIAVSPDSKMIVSASEDQTIKLWEVKTGKCIRTISSYANPLSTAMFSADGILIATGHGDGYVRLWNAQANSQTNTQTSECLAKLFHDQRGVTATTFHPQQSLLASGGKDGKIRIWQLNTLKCTHLLEGHSDRITTLTYSGDAQLIASSSADFTIQIWNAETGEQLHILREHTDRIGAIAFHPHKAWLISTSEDKTAKIWNIQQGNCLQTLIGHTNRLTSVAIHPHNGYIATGGIDNLIIIWDDRGTEIRRLTGHTGWILSLAFSPNGEWLASCGGDRTIKLWQIETGICHQTLQGHKNWIWQVSFSPDSEYIVTASEDETAKVWNISQGNCILTLRVPLPCEGMKLTGTTGLTSAQKTMLRSLGAL